MTAIALPPPGLIRTRLPGVGRVGVICFLWVLPFHSFVIALLFGYFGVEADTARAVASWKEVTIAALLGWVVLRAILSRGPGVEIAAPDVAVTALITVAVVFLLLENPLFNAHLPVGAELYGLRDSVLFMLLYYVGRATPELAETDTVLKHAFLVALVVSVIGILERVFLSLDMLVILGVASYMNDFLGLSAYTVGNEWGLPQNYWSIIGGVPVRRAGSVFLHSQGFAVPFLFLIPAATAWALNRRQKHPTLARVGYALIWIGLLLTITRMTTIICVAQVAFFYLIMRRPEWTLGASVTTIALGAITVLVVPGLLHFVWQTLSWQTASGTSHVKDWSQGALAFFAQPWGHGLGTTDSAPLKFFRAPLAADNMYLSYAVQLGVAGLAAFIATLATIFATSWRAAWSGPDDLQRRHAAVIALATFGIFLNGMTSFVFSSHLLAYVFFWQAGAVVTMSQRIDAIRQRA